MQELKLIGSPILTRATADDVHRSGETLIFPCNALRKTGKRHALARRCHQIDVDFCWRAGSHLPAG